MELQRNTHHVYRLMYHFVWIPKYRHKVFEDPYRTVLKDIIRKVGYDYDIDIVELEVPTDHIHMVVRSEPKVSPSEVMQIVKSVAAREFFRLHPEVKKKYFWGGTVKRKFLRKGLLGRKRPSLRPMRLAFGQPEFSNLYLP